LALSKKIQSRDFSHRATYAVMLSFISFFSTFYLRSLLYFSLFIELVCLVFKLKQKYTYDCSIRVTAVLSVSLMPTIEGYGLPIYVWGRFHSLQDYARLVAVLLVAQALKMILWLGKC